MLHGCDWDVLWLQRDFGIYIANLFDTGQATRVLQHKQFGLASIMERYAGIKVNRALGMFRAMSGGKSRRVCTAQSIIGIVSVVLVQDNLWRLVSFTLGELPLKPHQPALFVPHIVFDMCLTY